MGASFSDWVSHRLRVSKRVRRQLFFVGAALGSVLARLLGIPIELGAGVGLAAVFAASSNTPLALSIMAMELLGGRVFPHVVIVCVLAYLMTGHRSIYPAQRLFTGKGGAPLAEPAALRDLRPSSAPPPKASEGAPPRNAG